MSAEHIGWFGWSPDANRFGWQSFLGCRPGGRKVPVEAVPARVADLSGLPPAFIGVGGLDLFVEENVDYARRVGFHDIYLWGGEWWYWMKMKKDYPAVWETGKELFRMYGKK